MRGTHRDWIIDRIRDKPWLYLAMDLAGNGMGDHPLVAWDTIFIPTGFDTIVDRAIFDGRPFVTGSYVEYRSITFSERELWDWPWTKVYVLLLGPLLLLIGWRPHAGARVLGVIGGGLGRDVHRVLAVLGLRVLPPELEHARVPADALAARGVLDAGARAWPATRTGTPPG